jgi:hypothetical protein
MEAVKGFQQISANYSHRIVQCMAVNVVCIGVFYLLQTLLHYFTSKYSSAEDAEMMLSRQQQNMLHLPSMTIQAIVHTLLLSITSLCLLILFIFTRLVNTIWFQASLNRQRESAFLSSSRKLS